jgi:glutamate/tyrosine decarboxylase-like PLP-dependent enzyme
MTHSTNPSASDPSTLSLPPDEMRRLGYQVVDMLVEHLAAVRDKPVTLTLTSEQTAALIGGEFPEQPTPLDALLRELNGRVFRYVGLTMHPRFFAFVPSPSNYVSALGDALAAGFNIFLGNRLEAAGPSRVEDICVDWLRRLCGLPDGAGGIFVSGGSVANLTALAVARHVKLPIASAPARRLAVAFCSDQTHSCVERAFRLMGFARDQLVRIASDEQYRLPLEELARRVAAARDEGRLPFCVIANAGTTNTGAVDPLPELAEFCRTEGLWLHVDGAYGAAAMLCQEARPLLRGLELADSLAVDPHKWLFQPYEIGCALVRDAGQLHDAFRTTAEYMSVVHRAGEVNYQDCGIQLTRSFRALKLWLSLRFFGVAAFREAVQRGIHMAEFAESVIRQTPDLEVVSPARLAIVGFRYTGSTLSSADQADAVNEAIVARLLAEGFTTVTSTGLRGRRVLRLCTINPRTTEDDIRQTIRHLAQAGERSEVGGQTSEL